jgi:hypothetical protein
MTLTGIAIVDNYATRLLQMTHDVVAFALLAVWTLLFLCSKLVSRVLAPTLAHSSTLCEQIMLSAHLCMNLKLE